LANSIIANISNALKYFDGTFTLSINFAKEELLNLG